MRRIAGTMCTLAFDAIDEISSIGTNGFSPIDRLSACREATLPE
jgi:hypothetical protein